MTASDTSARPLRVLVVCYANRTRSPLAAVLLARACQDRGVEVKVRSAGVSEPGKAADRIARGLAAELGLDLSGHRSAVVTPEVLGRADLVLTMTSALLREVVLLARETWPRTFTLRELAARAVEVPPDGTSDAAAWIAACSHGRSTRRLLGEHADLDVEDPTGGPEAGYRRTLFELEELVGGLADALARCAPVRARHA